MEVSAEVKLTRDRIAGDQPESTKFLLPSLLLLSSDTGGDLDSKWRAAAYEGVTRANAVLRVMRLAKDIFAG